MKVRCSLCRHEQEAEHLSVRCEACGARGANVMGFAPSASAVKPGEPIVGPSRVPITGGARSAMRGPQQEPVEVTRQRRLEVQRLLAAGKLRAEAEATARRLVPIQCGRCGGVTRDCPVCGGVATAPTAALAERLAAMREPRRRRRRP